MMKTKLKALVGGLGWAAVIAWSGCATTPAARVEANATTVATWPADVQAKVKAGEAAIGFTPEQVRTALGEPGRISLRTEADGTREVWLYSARRGRVSFGVGAGLGGGSGFGGLSVSSGSGRRGGESSKVTFTDGLVSAIEQEKR